MSIETKCEKLTKEEKESKKQDKIRDLAEKIYINEVANTKGYISIEICFDNAKEFYRYAEENGFC